MKQPKYYKYTIKLNGKLIETTLATNKKNASMFLDWLAEKHRCYQKDFKIERL